MSTSEPGGPVRLVPSFREKVWGTPRLEPWFPGVRGKIGEVWFLSEGEPAPLLVKFIFTAERLSVQVHPDDDYARERESSAGKTEMWHILRAEPGSTIALGLRETLSREQLHSAAASGEIENLLHWIPVEVGDTILIPAGTIHALGGGIALCEVQQQSDITYRLYDYGRPRELHLDKATEVASLDPHPGKTFPVAVSDGEQRLAACEYFVTDSLEFRTPGLYQPLAGRAQMLIAIEGAGALAGNPFQAGAAWLVPAGTPPFPVEPEDRSRLLRTYIP
jgi:mannose-6-phosphate isomerase